MTNRGEDDGKHVLSQTAQGRDPKGPILTDYNFKLRADYNFQLRADYNFNLSLSNSPNVSQLFPIFLY